MQIGEVAERTGLSLRTIRHYGEIGLVRPSARSAGGFRLYDKKDVARLGIIARMKPLNFSVEEMQDVLDILDQLAALRPDTDRHDHNIERLTHYINVAKVHVQAIREQLETAEGFAAHLRHEISVYTHD